MDEVRRFLRYTLPGLSVVMQLLVALWITDGSCIQNLFGSEGLVQGLGIVLAVFLASGALGYLLANIYFALYWSWPCSRTIAIDHTQVFTQLAGIIDLTDGRGEPVTGVSRREAWTVVDQYWHATADEDARIKGVTATADGLTDIMHGVGATIVGSVFALIVWAGVHSSRLPASTLSQCGQIAIIIVWIVLIALFATGWYRTRSALQSIVNSTMTAVIRDKSSALSGGKVPIYYVK